MDFENPTPIDSHAVYIVVANGESMVGADSQGVTIRAQPGDYLNWFGVSESNNFNNEIIVYDAAFSNRADILSTPNFVQIGYVSMEPPIGYPASDPVEQTGTTWYITAVILRRGEGVYNMQFALYVPGAKGGMELYGYFQWAAIVQIR